MYLKMSLGNDFISASICLYTVEWGGGGRGCIFFSSQKQKTMEYEIISMLPQL